jgi:hypothetical protein
VDFQNKAGYTAVMLASLTAPDSSGDMEVVGRLMELGDVNAQASQVTVTASVDTPNTHLILHPNSIIWYILYCRTKHLSLLTLAFLSAMLYQLSHMGIPWSLSAQKS